MRELSSEGLKIVDDLARRHGVSGEAVAALLRALALGNGTQAQFNHPDLGGMGQWSQGGMIMIGDMFNQGLKYRVDALCQEIASLLRSEPSLNRPAASQTQSQGQGGGYAGVSLFIPDSGQSSSNWWPSGLGTPGSTGAQNNLQYACFPLTRRLAIRHGDRVTVYDTGEHRISGFSQQQSGDQSLTFTSQYGLVRVADLPLVTGSNQDLHDPAVVAPPESSVPQRPATSTPAPTPAHASAASVRAPAPVATAAPVEPAPPQAPAASSGAPAPASPDDIVTMIERLSDLHQKSILTEAEFAAKKAELLSRL
ncbi:MAG: SHOCT domain-containing protein [Beijerinckiaceae bacterium]|nr:SHOCT domain-containing protein [Beijerinckiaceae bacterium]